MYSFNEVTYALKQDVSNSKECVILKDTTSMVISASGDDASPAWTPEAAACVTCCGCEHDTLV